jgi:C4-dicarboxylate transporter, DctM subunit
VKNRRTIAFAAVALAILLLPLAGPGGVVAAIVLGTALLGAPLFVLLGALALSAFYFLTEGYDSIEAYQGIVVRFGDLGEKEPLLAIVFFMLSGTIMARGEISRRLVDFSRAVVGWVPGGLAVSGVLACMLFASISGSSPATVVAIGGMLGPTLIKQGYSERFSHGLLMSAGSLGILIPPSIPMILYPIVNQQEFIEVERLFAAGFGPGFLLGLIFAGLCVIQGIRDKAPVDPFELGRLGRATLDGFWALLFPITILGGIYGGILTAVEASAFSVVYALLVEIFIHRALTWRDVPLIIKDTTILLGSLLVIMVAAYAFTEFLNAEQIPAALTEWIQSFDLGPIGFLLIVNVLLIFVGMAMDIMSAMFVFVPLLAPIAAAFGIDAVHFGIIFIVNLEIGYLTPPVGLNLFVGSNLFNRSIGHVIKAVLPFIAAMFIGLGVVTYVPAVSIGLADVILGVEQPAESDLPDAPTTPRGEAPMTLEEMMREAEGGAPAPKRVLTMEEMMREAEATPDDEDQENDGDDEIDALDEEGDLEDDD